VQFKNLYEQVEAQPTLPVGFEFLRRAIVRELAEIQEVKVWRLTYNPPTGEAHFTLYDDRSSAYEGEYLVADISYCSSLEQDPAELLFALSKELMHVFDPAESRIDTKEKFIKFLKDLQNTPLDQTNGALHAEHRARWMTILVLCPKRLRDELCAEINEGQALRIEVAQRLGLPEWAIEVILDAYYDVAWETLTQR
jgi:hypothetical protein